MRGGDRDLGKAARADLEVPDLVGSLLRKPQVVVEPGLDLNWLALRGGDRDLGKGIGVLLEEPDLVCRVLRKPDIAIRTLGDAEYFRARQIAGLP